MATPSEHITAIAALSRIAEIRQFELNENYDHLVVVPLVQIINENARLATGIDLLNTKKALSFDEFDKYESFLEKILDSNLTHKLSDSFLFDELELMGKVEDFPIDTYRSFDIKAELIRSYVKKAFKSLGVITPTLIYALKNPIRVLTIRYDKIEGMHFLVLTKLEVKSKTLFFIFHATYGKVAMMKGEPKSLDYAFRNMNPNANMNFSVSSSFVYSSSIVDSHDLVHMFINGLIKYGNNITIADVTKKFFLEGHSSKLLIKQSDKIIFDNGLSNDSGSGVIQISKTPTGYKYYFLYSIDQVKFLADISRHNFL